MEQKAKRIGKLNIIDLIAIVLIVAVLALPPDTAHIASSSIDHIVDDDVVRRFIAFSDAIANRSDSHALAWRKKRRVIGAARQPMPAIRFKCNAHQRRSCGCDPDSGGSVSFRTQRFSATSRGNTIRRPLSWRNTESAV